MPKAPSVTLKVGSLRKLGGHVLIPDVEGVWFELVRNVSHMLVFVVNASDA